ncbi:MAG: PQQ-binding-like beta-propeller repeat protein, partial [Methanolinea sp.]|nr:PQQ-binding-like beta-propeller repeat protein [Methanolinea sp.]
SPAVVDGLVYVGSNDWYVYALNATTGEKIWSTYTNGEVTSSPAVVGGVVYVGSNDRQVYALNAVTGEKIWSTYTNGEVRSSPAVVGGVVYVGSNDRYVYALNATTGEKIWSTYTNGEVTSSPAVVDGVVYVGSNDHRVYALGTKFPVPSFTASPASGPYPLTVTFTDTSTGDITGWHWDFGDGSSSTLQNPVHTYRSPGIYPVNLTVTGPAGTRSLVVPDSVRVTFDFSGTPRSGQPPLTITFTDTLPADTTGRNWDFGDGQTGTGQNPVHTYTAPGSFTVTLNATGPGWAATLEKKNYISMDVIPAPTVRWKVREGITSIGSPPVIDSGTAYVDGGTTLFAIDTRTGTERWRFATGAECSISEVYGGVVFVRAGTTLYAIDSQSGGEKWRFSAPEKLGRPSRYIGVICLNSGNTVYGIDLSTGSEKWHVTKTEPFTEVTIGEGIVSGDLYAGSGKTLYALQTHTGRERWHRDYNDIVGLQPIASDNLVIAGTRPAKTEELPYDRWTFHAVDMRDGKELWTTRVYTDPVGYPQIVDGTFLFVSNERSRAALRAIDLLTGKELWSYSERPDYSSDAKYIASGDTILSCFTIHYTKCSAIYCSDWDSWTLVSLDRKTGRKLWEMDLSGAGVKGLPVVAHDIAYIGLKKTNNGNILALHMNGTTVWYSQIGGGDFGFPAFSNGVVYGKGSDGYFYAVGNSLSFSATPTFGMAPLTVTFRDTTPQKTTGWSWSFGDGTTGTGQNPVHTYTRPGTYTVRFSAWDAAGSVSHEEPECIRVDTNLTFSRIQPGYGIRGTTAPVTIFGGNFTGDLSVTLTRGSRVIPVTNSVVVDNATISGTLAIPGDAPIGPYDLSIARASDGNILKVQGAFMVLQYPPPIVASVDPSSTKAGTLQQFTLNGSNFQLGATVVFTNITGAELTTTAVKNSESEIILTATFPVNGAGPWNVTVTNPDGGTSTLPHALDVMPSNVETPPPTVNSVSPAWGTAGTSLAMSISGSGFTRGSSVKLCRGAYELPGSQVVILKPTQMRATVTVPGNAVPGLYDFVVINGEGQAGVLPGAVTIGNRTCPILSRITPGTMTAGTTTAFSLTGDRFRQGAAVIFSKTPGGVMMADVTSVNEKQIKGTLSIPEGTDTGTWSVMVINPDGGTGRIPDAVTVTSPSGDGGSGPSVTSVKPASGSAGKTVGLLIAGEGFTKGSSVSIRDEGYEVTASRVLTMDPTKLFAILKIPANATPGAYDLVVTDSGGRSGTLPCGFSVL